MFSSKNLYKKRRLQNHYRTRNQYINRELNPYTYNRSNRSDTFITGRQLRFYFLLFIITTFIVGITLNRIELNIVVEQLKEEGIDYDSFREMLIPSKMIKDIKRKMDKELETNEINTKKGSQTYDTADYITLAMLLNRYNLNNARNIGKSNSNFIISNLSQNKSFIELKAYYKAILGDIKCFPVIPISDGELNVTFIDTWNAYRSYGGNRRHEGTDIMSKENLRGVYPIVSMTDGTVEKMGWLEQGGYRIGIRGTYGAYYYYAHLESYAPDLKIGDSIKAGDFLGYMGDSGYGAEGTVGEFDVHLHVGIYVETDFGELSVNPYSILLYLESIKGSKEK